jgi:hypothetical protein
MDSLKEQALRAQVDTLRKALEKSLAHVLELEDAWQRGCISEHDGKGGLRSNRNVEVRVTIRAALAANPQLPEIKGECMSYTTSGFFQYPCGCIPTTTNAIQQPPFCRTHNPKGIIAAAPQSPEEDT